MSETTTLYTQATTSLVYRPDWKARAVELLLAQHRNKPRIVALVQALAEGGQAVEDDFFSLAFSRVLSLATGAQLEQWGDLVGERRGGLSDPDYRRFIEARLLMNRTHGDTDTVIQIFGLITAPSVVKHHNHYPATAVLQAFRDDWLSEPVRRRVRRAMESIRPGGVAFQLIEILPGYFGWKDDPTSLGYDTGRFSRVI